MSRRARLVVLGVLAAAFLGSGLVQARSDGLAADEGDDIAAGVTTLVDREVRIVPEHALLGTVALAAPSLLAHPTVPHTTAYDEGRWFDYVDDFVRAQRRDGRLDRVLFLARLAPLLEGIAVGLLLYRLGERLAGGGLVAAGLWFTTPFTLGFSHLATIDIAFTLTVVLVATALERHFRSPTDATAAVVGLALGAALLARHTGIALAVGIAVAVVIGQVTNARAALRHLGIALILGWALVWVGYRAVDPGGPSAPTSARNAAIIHAAEDRSALARVSLAVPWPQEYRAGFGYLVLTSGSRPAFLLGHSWTGTRLWFFPMSLALKLPLISLPLMAAGLLVWRRRGSGARAALVSVAIPAIAVGAFVLAQPLNLGVRYVMPVFALLCVLVAPAAKLVRSRLGAIAIGVVALAQVAAFASAHPHSLTWITPPARPAYRYVSDSNLDYGQDLPAVERWSVHRRAYVALTLSRGLDIPPGDMQLVGTPPRDITGWVAVGASPLTVTDRGELAWLRAYCPVGDLGGGSVLLYRFATPPDPAPGPAQPVGPCFEDRFSTRR